MKEELRQKILKRLQEQNNIHNEINVKLCERCKTKLTVFVRQTRSADEGATTFLRCPKCDKTTRKN